MVHVGNVRWSIRGVSARAEVRPNGGVRADLEADTWPGTGRMVRLPMHTLTQRELVGERLSKPWGLAGGEPGGRWTAPDDGDLRESRGHG